ncbi:LamG domain-containing protein [Pseudoalteromonas denitrificans]|uniref:Concanavalin A-like lectin/glucanases superfamily protein n=1 Tax=Pseudoalteromonas denitrificans DSM 6059 TaxID=1123010 RepID=A0A1I1DRQ0_9GAMM|nr:LamG domain-containing protein [Pseudoalteromonas denitrificans]SFB77477.1 Concanavalin A-like lectin/glucanases superfamily protein [Pseudoalteromonas denitrificans DSM 6059]
MIKTFISVLLIVKRCCLAVFVMCFSFLFNFNYAYATSCSDIFPGPKPFTTDSVESIESGVTCNSGSCNNPPSFTAVNPFPSISPSGNFNSTSITNGIYQHNGWGLGDGAQVNFSGSGTAIIYFKSNDVVIKKNTDINKNGDPANVILIFKGKLKIEEGAEISAFIYVKGNETTIEKNSVINGGIAAKKKLTLKENSTYTYTPANLNNLDTQGFCTNTPVITVDHYEIHHDGSASTCASESVTIKACLNSDCSTLVNSSVGLGFTLGGNTVSSTTFTGSTTFNFANTNTGSMALNITNETVTASSGLVCNDGSGTSCNISYSSAGCSNSCFAYFSDVVQGHNSSSSIKFKDTGQLLLDSDNTVSFPTLTEDANVPAGHNTCGLVDCTTSGVSAPALSLPTFQTTAATDDISVSSGSITIGPSGTFPITEIDNLTISGTANVTFNPASSDYKIDNGLFSSSAKITFNTGTYWFDELEILDSSEVIINGAVTIYVNGQANHFDIEDNAKINVGGNAKNLVLVSYKQIHMKNDTEVHAVLYSAGQDIHIQNQAKHFGAISVFGKLEIKGTATVNYEDVSGVQVGSLCGNPPSVDHYEIHHDGAGSVCDAESITIKACEDASCSSLYTSPVSLNFQINGITSSSPTFTGSTNITFEHTVTETLTFSINSPSTAPSNAFECNDGVGASCNMIVGSCALCSAVFPSGYNQATSINEKLANFPNNNSAITLNTTTTLNRGDNLYLDSALTSSNEIFVAPAVGSETTARLYFRGGVSWHNTKINQSGNPEDLVVVVDGSASISGASTVINAIIYVKGTTSVSGGGIINGAITTEGGGSGLANYNASYISNADFNGMCDIGAVHGGGVVNAHYPLDLCGDLDGFAISELINNYLATGSNLLITSLGVVNSAANLTADTSNDYIQFNDVTPLQGKTSFSVSSWFSISNHKATHGLFSALDSGNQVEFEVKLNYSSGSTYTPRIILDHTWKDFDDIQVQDDNSWHHLVVSVSNGNVCLFVNGQSKSCKALPSVALNITTFVAGQLLNSTSPNSGFSGLRGRLDEILVFDNSLNASEVANIYTNQLAGNNYDGTSRNDVCLIGEWRLENNFLDSILSDPHNLSPVNSPVFGISNPGPANINGLLSTCNYVGFDGTNYASVDDTGAFNSDQLTVSAWIHPTSIPGSGIRGLVSKDEHFEFHINDLGKLYWWWTNASNSPHSITSNATIAINTWTHVAVVFSNGAQSMYINGVLDSSETYSDGLADSPCNFYIGTDVATNTLSQCGSVLTNRNFQGYMDEVRIYTRALSQTDIQTDMNFVHSCGNLVNHYRLELSDSAGLTCESENINLKACSDVNCTSLASESSTVNLSPSPIATTSWSPSESFPFTGQQAVTFSNTTATEITYALDSATPSAGLRCFINGNEVASLADCKTVFSDVGFRYIDDADNALIIKTQLSGKPSNTGYHSQSMYLQAVKTDDNTGSCTAAFPSGQDVPVKLSYTCHADSSSCTNNLVMNNNSNDIGLTTTDVVQNLRFDADSKAAFSIKYPDAGKVLINAQADITVGAITKNITASTNAFVVRPFGFKLDFPVGTEQTSAFATNSSGSVFKNTDVSFSLGATAVQWVTGEDSNNDGIPDDFSLLTNNATAMHFDNETLSLTARLIQPLGGVLGSLSETLGSTFGNSVIVNRYKYNEVGIIGLDAILTGNNYLAGGSGVIGKIENVGRFVPAAFALKPASDSFTHSCSASFTYLGQNFTGQYIVHAISDRSNASSSITQNYAGGFAKSTVEVKLENNQIGNDDNGVALYKKHDDFIDSNSNHRFTDVTGAWANGIYTVNSANFTLKRDSQVDGAFSDVQFVLMAADGETTRFTELINKNENPDVNNLSSTCIGTACTGVTLGAINNFRYGRVVLENNYGSELEDILVPMKVEYWDNTIGSFRLSNLDSCTDYNLADLTIEPSYSKSGVDATFIFGQYPTGGGLKLDAPNVNGSTQVEFNVFDYLQFDWKPLIAGDENPTANIQFGRYRGNDRVISWREQ